MIMKRRLGTCGILLGILLTELGFANWVLNSPTEVKEEIGLTNPGGIIECYKVNGKTEDSEPYAKFVTLEGAVNSANEVVKTSSGVNMYLTTKSFIDVVNQDLTLTSGVSLYLPYDGKTYDISTDEDIKKLSDGFIDINENKIKTYNVGKLSFKNSCLTIKNGATVYIGGQFREKGVSGFYTEIDLDATSHITVEGSLYCHGYIKEIKASNVSQNGRADFNLFFNSFDEQRYVEVKSGGYFSSPLAFYDAGGMGGLVGLNSKGVFPINVFDLPCTQTYLKINSGATFKAPARMLRDTFPVNEAITLVKPSNSSLESLMTLKSGYVSFEYCPLNPGFTDNDRSKMFIVVNGEVELGFLKISVNGTDISTEDKFLPFSYKLQVIIGEKGTFKTGKYKIKFMGGSMLKILQKGTFVNQSQIIGYRENSIKGIVNYPVDVGEAKMIVNGTFKLEKSAYIGFHISTEAVDTSAQIDFLDVAKGNLTVSSSEGLSQTVIKITSTGDFFDEEENEISSNLFKTSILIKSDSQGRRCWADGGNLISYVLTIVADNARNYEHPLIGYKVYKYDSSGNKTELTTEGVYMVSDGEFAFEKGDSFQVESLERAEKTEFTKQKGSSYSFANGTKYEIKGDTEITITPGEGVLVRFSIDNESGAGGSTVKVLESLTKGGNYYQIGQSSGGATIDVPVKKNAYVEYEVTQGPNKAKILENHYLFDVLVNIPASGDSDEAKKNNEDSKNNGTKLKTKFKNNNIFHALTGGAKSTSTDTLITKTSTIHAYIKN